MTHAECNAHILRYLKGVIETFKREKPQELLKFLVDINNAKKEAVEAGVELFEEEKIEDIEGEYVRILEGWKVEYEEETKGKSKKALKYYDEERCLLTRLLKYKEEHLLFVKDFRVPFDNNLAERSLRLIKSKIKVSGGFRSKSGSESFANIRSIILKLRTRNKPYKC